MQKCSSVLCKTSLFLNGFLKKVQAPQKVWETFLSTKIPEMVVEALKRFLSSCQCKPTWTKPREPEPRNSSFQCFLMFYVQSVVTLDIWKSVTWPSDWLTEAYIINRLLWLSWFFLSIMRLKPGPEEDLDPYPLQTLEETIMWTVLTSL